MRRPVVDAHLHLYDHTANTHPFLEKPDPVFEELVGDYTALPRRYLLDDYLSDSPSQDVQGLIWHEFISTDPVKEARWAQHLADSSPVPMTIVALADFLDPRLEERLDIFHSLPNVTAVRQHLGWDEANPLRRMTTRPDLLRDAAWQRGLRKLNGYDLRCELEIFASQSQDLLQVVRLYPNRGFAVVVMGWPNDLSEDGFVRWTHDVTALAVCDNVVASISAVECIFGMNWTIEQVRPWIMTLIERFGPSRCMIGSHLPISKLSYGFARLYEAYEMILAGFSEAERDQMFRTTAMEWFRLKC